MNRIDKKFAELKKNKKKAFIAFITAGYPNLSVTEKLIHAFEKAGVDILELGVPFSDPMADGPVIQEASQEALKKNANLAKILRLVKKARKDKVQMPICLMTYYNPVFCFPEPKFVAEAAKSGVDGLIIPDLPPEEARELLAKAGSAGLDVISFIAPTTSLKRVKSIVKSARGFIYYVSVTGVTGARRALPANLAKSIKLIKNNTKKPVCVGFGVSNALQVKEIGGLCDGVIVGSAIVKKIKENKFNPDLVRKVSSFVAALKR
jgi:tryptophan synthase alpha chain